MPTLLEIARGVERTPPGRPARPVSDDDLELMIAVAAREVSATQAAKAMGIERAAVYSRLGSIAVAALRDGRLTVNRRRMTR